MGIISVWLSCSGNMPEKSTLVTSTTAVDLLSPACCVQEREREIERESERERETERQRDRERQTERGEEQTLNSHKEATA